MNEMNLDKNKENQQEAEKNLKKIFENLNKLNLQKYKNQKFKEHLMNFNTVFDPITKLHPYDKIILIYENLIENAILLYSLNPNKEMLEISKKFQKQAEEFFKLVIKPLFNDKEAQSIEEEKIKKLEEFMNNLNIEL